ncbi:TetR family transcriptional regulator C-terminal domain-containing protein [Aureisphaera galaxeae]|uniref:TetR family transcriptional regulator C-terminal domain-containing protein n=1 Tax=Aureisphaera galaxeae TaxID=1538023 RepID=UPI002350E8B4|nr:TetR family transcriptional regulator C-terminal domain-containing protein [Aureisphaera galaxeae]MDC8006183.1 TetR family transcriptional regulator C-terminal domain-containing protein [Aureisphaera galaxeae]
MAQKKKITADHLISIYMEHVLENSAAPASVYSFAKDNGFEETEFYKFFGSFRALEKGIFQAFFDNTIKTLHKSKDYENYDARNKLLSFHFTFFELLTANRSYVVYALQGGGQMLKSMEVLSGVRTSYMEYVSELDLGLPSIKQETLHRIQQRSLKESAWGQLLLTLKFWMDDTSPAFEKTDIFIEKSIQASMDLIDTTPLKSVLDFGKFLIKEKTPFTS